MKRVLLIFMCIVMTLTMFSCGGSEEAPAVDPKEEAKAKLAEAYETCCPEDGRSVYAKLGYDKMSLVIDTNPYDSEYLIDYESEAVTAVMAVNVFLELPSSVSEKISSTRALDGTQTQNCGTYSITWNYHPDNGLKVIYEVNP